MAEFDEPVYERDYPREIINADAEVMIDEQWLDCVIVDISPSGAKLQVSREVDWGKSVFIQLGEFGQFSATVVWCRGGEIGVKFDHDPLAMTSVMIGLTS